LQAGMSHVMAKIICMNNKHCSVIPEADSGGGVPGIFLNLLYPLDWSFPKQTRWSLCMRLHFRCISLPPPDPSSEEQGFPVEAEHQLVLYGPR
jgi:hypothetical protein